MAWNATDLKKERNYYGMNENERDGSRIGENEHMERPKRRKVNIVRDGICRNYCSIKIYRVSKPRTYR